MASSEPINQCPFCNAPWGKCSHVRLLAEWEEQALVREAERELGASSAAGHLPDQTKPAPLPDPLTRRTGG